MFNKHMEKETGRMKSVPLMRILSVTLTFSFSRKGKCLC